MGNEVSGEADDGSRPTAGYHVLRVNDGSPGQKAGLMPYFDFIVSVGATALTEEDSRLVC